MDSFNNTTDGQQSHETPQCSTRINKPTLKKSKRTGSLNQKRKNRKLRPWKQWLAQTARIKYTLPPTEPEESSYNLRKLFNMSSDLSNPIASRQQSFNLNIFNMLPVQTANTEAQLKDQVSSIKVEILSVASKKHFEKEEFHKSEIIIISDSESESETEETSSGKNPVTNCENKTKGVPVIDRGFYQETSTSKPATLSNSQQSSKIEILNWPLLQKTKTEEYLKSQPLNSFKVDVINPANGEFPKSAVSVSDSVSVTKGTSFENKMATNFVNKIKVIPIIDKGFYQETSASMPAIHDHSQQSSKLEIMNWPLLQKTKTEEYLKSQPLYSSKAEVLDVTNKKAAKDNVGKGLNQEENKVREVMAPPEKALETKMFATNFNTDSQHNITLKIFQTPIKESSITGQASNIIKFEITTEPQEKCISAEDADTSEMCNSQKELQNSKVSEKFANLESKNPVNNTASNSSPKPSISNAQLSNNLKEEVVKLKNLIPQSNNSEINSAFNNQSLQTDCYKLGSMKKPYTFKQIVKSLRKAGEIPTQSNKNPKLNANATLPQISTSNSLTSKSGFPTLRQRQLELHRLRVQVGEISTQTTKTPKINANDTLPQISTSNSLTSKSVFPTLRQRQMELHSLRVQVEQKRLELLDLKLAREWQEMKNSKLEFDKNLKAKRFEVLKLDDSTDI